MGNSIAVVAFCYKTGGLFDGLLGVARSTGNACQSHHVQVVIAIAAAQQLARLAPYSFQKFPECFGFVDSFWHDFEQKTLAATNAEIGIELPTKSLFQVPKLARSACYEAFVLGFCDGLGEVVRLYQRHLIGSGNIDGTLIGFALNDDAIAFVAVDAKVAAYDFYKLWNEGKRNGLFLDGFALGTIPNEAPVKGNNEASEPLQLELLGKGKDAVKWASTCKNDGKSALLCL